MNVKIEESWKAVLGDEFKKPYFRNLAAFIKQEVKTYTVYPPGKLIFNAFDHCSFDKTKVVIMGQDPYHGPNQAHGLSFSVQDGVQSPPSLTNIFKAIQLDLNKPIPRSGNLERWAKQGVLLLNSILTVRKNQAASHQNKGWETFTDMVIYRLSRKKTGLVFLLWGSYAKNKGRIIDKTNHLVLESAHPSPLSAHYGFFDNKHFSKANDYLESQGKSPIEW